jgi:hypothetical protein
MKKAIKKDWQKKPGCHICPFLTDYGVRGAFDPELKKDVRVRILVCKYNGERDGKLAGFEISAENWPCALPTPSTCPFGKPPKVIFGR